MRVNTQRANQKRQSRAFLEAENWNLKHPVGTPVVLRMDSGEKRETKTRSEAYVSYAGYAVCFFEGVSGHYLLSHATPAVSK